MWKVAQTRLATSVILREMKGREKVCIGQLKFTEEEHLLKVNKIRIFESLAVAQLSEEGRLAPAPNSCVS
jgi:hypothetical protein